MPVNRIVGRSDARTLVCIATLELRKETLNAANIYLVEIKLTKCKYIDRSSQHKKSFQDKLTEIKTLNNKFYIFE